MSEPDVPSVMMPDPEPGLMEVALLHDLIRWREQLARSIARNNLDFHSDGIMTVVNRVLLPLLFLRAAEERHVIEDGTLAALRTLPDISLIQDDLAPYSDALYAEDVPDLMHRHDSPDVAVIEERVVHAVIDALLAPCRKYDFGTMTTLAIAQVLMQYLTRTVRRSATHMATVVDTHDTVLSGGTVIPPLPLTGYLVGNTLAAARKDRPAREVMPLRVFDPACGSGTVLLAVYRGLLENAGGPALTFDDRREILENSVHGLDISRHAVAVTRMLLCLELFSSPQTGPFPEDFRAATLSVLRDLRHTVLCGNALVGPEIVDDESWMFCPARDRHRLNPFRYRDRFPEIVAGGGFDIIVCNPPEGALEQREWIQQYFQRRYAAYHPLADRSAYFIEKSLSLVTPGGVVALCLSSRWLRGAPGSPLRELLASHRIDEIADLTAVPAGSPGAGLLLIRIRASRPGRLFDAVCGGAGFVSDPAGFSSRNRFPVEQQQLDAGGWKFRDTRADVLLEKVRRHSSPLEDVVMGQVHPGIRIPEDDPFVIDGALAREWIRRDPRCKALLRPLLAEENARLQEKFLILVPCGWTRDHQNADRDAWQWFRHRHPLIAKHLQKFSEILKARTGQQIFWWETACDEFWQEPKKKLVFARESGRPVFRFDTGRGFGDATVIAIPSAGLYLAGILNSRLMAFVLDRMARQLSSGKNNFSWDELGQLPVYTPDLDRPDERALHDRVEHHVRRKIDLEKNFRNATTDPEREALQKKIRATGAKIDALVYDLYGLTLEEIAVVESIR